MSSPPPSRLQRLAIIGSTLLALFLAAMDALIMSAAMPTIVSELGGLQLYSWVYSAYFLARAVALPIFGKLADLYSNKRLFICATSLFLLGSVAAGCSANMVFLIGARVIQGIGAGGIFALVYIVLAQVSRPENRGRTLSFASSVWGISSVLGPTLGGFIVSYFSWRWIFFINIPLSLLSVWGIGVFLSELRPTRDRIDLDLAGVIALTTGTLSLLFAFLLGGRDHGWGDPLILGLFGLSIISLFCLVKIELRTTEPILPVELFRLRSFSSGNGAVFLSSFAIFSMFAYAPLFIQGAQARSPMVVGMAMLSLSLGWSLGSLVLGQFVDRVGRKGVAIAGATLLATGSGLTLGFEADTPVSTMFGAFFVLGIGMGWVSLSTLLEVQACVKSRDLGVATASNQFARTLGGAVGVGICGSFVAAGFTDLSASLPLTEILAGLPEGLGQSGIGQLERLLSPEVQAVLPVSVRSQLQNTVVDSIRSIFGTVTIAAVLCLLVCLLIPSAKKSANH